MCVLFRPNSANADIVYANPLNGEFFREEEEPSNLALPPTDRHAPFDAERNGRRTEWKPG